MTATVEIEELVKVYKGGIRAVDGVSFEVNEQEIFGFLGPNGAGKSTTIKCVIGLLRPTSGRILIRGTDVRQNPKLVKRTIGYASQETAVDDRLTGWQNLFLQGRFFHLTRRQIAERGEEVLRLCGLWERRNDSAGTYSGGMLKRLDIAAALIHQPSVLFLDEPTLGLDVQTRKVIWEYIEKLRSEQKMTIFLTTHYMEEADALCDRLAIIDRGKIMAIDRPGTLKAQIGGDVITARFVALDERISRLVQAISALPDTVAVTSLEDGLKRIVVQKRGDQVIPEIFALAAKNEVSVESIRLHRPSLDDVYLHFTGREMRDEQGSREEIGRTRMMQRRLRR
jgi:ABC-2 type transport system ATP-binding protein